MSKPNNAVKPINAAVNAALATKPGTALAVVKPVEEMSRVEIMAQKERFVQPKLLAEAAKQQARAYGGWQTWAEAAYKAGTRKGMFEDAEENRLFRTEVKEVIAKAILTKSAHDLFSAPKAEMEKWTDAKKAERKKHQQLVGNMFGYAARQLSIHEDKSKAVESGDISAAEAGNGAGGRKRPFGVRVVEQVTKWADELKNREANTTAETEILAAFNNVLKLAKKIQ